MPASVRVEGLRELRLALGAVDARLPGELRDESREIAGDVREVAQRKLTADVVAPTGAAAASLRVFATMRAAGVRGGRASVPYYGWLDFGGTIRHHGASHQHQTAHLIRREYIAGGRYLYPAMDEQARLIEPRVELMLERLFTAAGFND